MTSNIVLRTIPSSYYTHQMVMGNLPYARRLNGQFMEIIHVGLAGKGTYRKGNLSILFVTGIIQRIQKLTLRFISTTIVTT
jgi:hypothetical protein